MANITITSNGAPCALDQSGTVSYTIDSFEYSKAPGDTEIISVSLTGTEFTHQAGWTYNPVKIESASYSAVVDALQKVDISFFKTSKILLSAAIGIIDLHGHGVYLTGYRVTGVDVKWIPDEEPEEDSVNVTVTLWESRPSRDSGNKVVVHCNGIDEQDFNTLKFRWNQETQSEH